MTETSIRIPPGPKPQPLDRRFWSHVEKEKRRNGCWNWTGFIDRSGHPRLRVKRPDGRWTDEYAYRLAWELVHGERPVGDLPPRCGNERCVNPAHRELLSASASRSRNVATRWVGHESKARRSRRAES